MFYDERIEQNRGNISKSSILFSTIIAFIIGLLRIVNIIKNTDGLIYLFLVSVEIVIVSSGFIIFLIDIIINSPKIKDEMQIASRNIFFNKAAIVHLYLSFISYSIVFPIVMNIRYPINFIDLPFDSIFLTLFFIIGTYLVYSFKKNDIYFNYSIMESEHYYKDIFKNILKLAKIILTLLLISIASLSLCVLFNRVNGVILLKNALTIFLSYLLAFILLSLLYFLYSHLEKTSYNSEKAISKSSMLPLLITIVIFSIYTAIVLFIDSFQNSQAQKMQFISYLSHLENAINLSFLIFLTYFSYEYQKYSQNNLAHTGCNVILLNKSIFVLFSTIQSSVINILYLSFSDNVYLRIAISDLNNIISNLSDIATLIGFSLIIISLIKDKFIEKYHLSVIMLLAISHGIGIFLYTQIDFIGLNIYKAVVSIAILCYFYLILHITGKKKVHS